MNYFSVSDTQVKHYFLGNVQNRPLGLIYVLGESDPCLHNGFLKEKMLEIFKKVTKRNIISISDFSLKPVNS